MAIAQILDVPTDLQACIDNCLRCQAICERTATHCLAMGGEHASRAHQTTLHDCSQICMTSAGFMIRESQSHPQVCGICAEVCARCAEECGRMHDGDMLMIRCAEACRLCKDTCERMAKAA